MPPTLPGFPDPLPPASRYGSRKRRADLAIALGRHPLGANLREPAGETCGSCRFSKHVFNSGWDGWKCNFLVTRSEASDLTLKWPACTLWQRSKFTAREKRNGYYNPETETFK